MDVPIFQYLDSRKTPVLSNHMSSARWDGCELGELQMAERAC